MVGSVCCVKRFTTGSPRWDCDRSRDFYSVGFITLVKRWDTCIDVGGRYVRNKCFFTSLNITCFTFYIQLSPIYWLSLEEFLDDGHSSVSDVTEYEMFLCLAIIIKMGHDTHDSLKDYWSNAEQFLHLFVAKHWNVRDSFTFSNFSTFRAMTKLLTIMIWIIPDYGKRHTFDLLNDAQNTVPLLST
jgi:hypothetical protein